MKRVSDIMTKDPSCCTSDTTLEEVAKLMIKCNCGEIPIIESETNKSVIGVITDRDICCRTIGKGLNPLQMNAGTVMSSPAITINKDDSLAQCADLMEKHQIRRVPVVDDNNQICGIVATADLAQVKKDLITDVIKEVSKPDETEFSDSVY